MKPTRVIAIASGKGGVGKNFLPKPWQKWASEWRFLMPTLVSPILNYQLALSQQKMSPNQLQVSNQPIVIEGHANSLSSDSYIVFWSIKVLPGNNWCAQGAKASRSLII